MKFEFILIPFLAIISLQKFAHAATKYARFCCDWFIRIWVRWKWNVYQIWIAIKKYLVKWAPICKAYPGFTEPWPSYIQRHIYPNFMEYEWVFVKLPVVFIFRVRTLLWSYIISPFYTDRGPGGNQDPVSIYRQDVLSWDLVKSRSREIGSLNYRIALKFDSTSAAVLPRCLSNFRAIRSF